MNFMSVHPRHFSHALVSMCPLDRFLKGEEPFIPMYRVDAGWRLRSEAIEGREIYISHIEIHDLLENGKAKIQYNFNSPAQQLLRNIFRGETWDEQEIEDQTIALYRERLILMFAADCDAAGKRLPFSEGVLAPYLRKYTNLINAENVAKATDGEGRADQVIDIQLFKRPSVKTLKRWHDRYYACDMDVMALLPRHRGPGHKLFAINPLDVAFAHKMAREYLDRRRPTMAHVYRSYLAALKAHNDPLPPSRQLGKVSRKKFETMIGKFDKFHVTIARHGEKYAIRKFMAIRRSFNVLAPGQRIEMDFVNFDLMSLIVESGIFNVLPLPVQEKIPRVRIYFGAAIDVATRGFLALKASLNPNGASAAETIRMIMSDKRHLSAYVGAQTPWIQKLRPSVIYHDNGTEFIAKRTQEILRLARIEGTRPPAGQPACRPFIESAFGTIGLLIAPYFEGRTFSSITEKGDYEPEKMASLLVEELIKIFIFAVLDIYHNKPHAGLGGNTPHNAWVEATKEYDILYPPARDEMLLIFGHKTKGRMSPYGITFMGITYDHPELRRMLAKFGQVDIPIKFDPECAFHIGFKTEKGWLVAENNVGLDPSVSLAEWIAARSELRAHYATAAEQGMKVMYDAINRLRAIGVAATIRAGLSPSVPVAADYLRWESQLFGEWRAVASEDTPPLLLEGPLADDPLNLGSVVERPELFRKDKMEEREPNADDESDKAVDEIQTSSFSYGEDD
ncbi:integrase catalytic domain-containing protein [Rhizobium leguminosarum]|uniref:integrase catalytic domain-containing protein n=1 Tax=Rhizobium leguminosarum TaxID=384 RepID=UPI000365D93D|nr:DDE-type integrase/transposase/recombinase [Rhizobium leguminosarum]